METVKAEQRTNKRRKISSPCNPQTIIDLPDTLLEAVAAYLPTISRGLFAVTLTAPSPSWHIRWNRKHERPPLSAASKVVLPSPDLDDTDTQYNAHTIINFNSIEKSLAAKLSDDDLCALLLCIDAKNVLKRLYLTGCVNITGCGLDPLRESVVLEQIDLTLVGQHSPPSMVKDAMITKEAILPILGSIVNQHDPDPSLKQVQFPSKWAEWIGPAMSTFMREFSLLLDSRPFNCSGCTSNREDCFGTNGADWIGDRTIQKFTCYKCLQNCCYGAQDNDINFCWLCDKVYCEECVRMANCTMCSRSSCNRCNYLGNERFYECQAISCDGCAESLL